MFAFERVLLYLLCGVLMKNLSVHMHGAKWTVIYSSLIFDIFAIATLFKGAGYTNIADFIFDCSTLYLVILVGLLARSLWKLQNY